MPFSRHSDPVRSMKHPALTGGVSLQFKLRLSRLLLALVSDILPNRGLIDAHRRGEQSSCPDSTSSSQYTFAKKCGNFSFSRRLVTLFRISTTFDTAYVGGITLCRCT